MDITSLTVVLSVVVIIAAAVLTVPNKPPLWVYLLTGAVALFLTRALLDVPALASAVGNSGAAEWTVRLAVASVLTAVLSFLVGKERRGVTGGVGAPPASGPRDRSAAARP